MIAVESKDKSKQRRYSCQIDLKDAYRIDFATIEILTNQLKHFSSRPISYIVSYEDQLKLSTENYDLVKTDASLETHQIKALSITSNFMDDTKFSLHLSGGISGSSFEVSGFDESIRYEGLTKFVSGQMRSKRTWYWPIYRTKFELFSIFIALILTLYIGLNYLKSIDADFRTVAVGIPMLASLALMRHFLFRRLEFAIGKSARNANSRSASRKFIGGTVVTGVLVNLLSDVVSWK